MSKVVLFLQGPRSVKLTYDIVKAINTVLKSSDAYLKRGVVNGREVTRRIYCQVTTPEEKREVRKMAGKLWSLMEHVGYEKSLVKMDYRGNDSVSCMVRAAPRERPVRLMMWDKRNGWGVQSASWELMIRGMTPEEALETVRQ